MPKELPWLPQTALDRMQSDLMEAGDITRAALSERIIADAAPLAAYSVVELATNAEDEGTRLRAAQYVLDRANGKPKTSVNLNVNQDNPVLRILDGVVVERGAAKRDLGPYPEDYYTDDPPATVIDQEPSQGPARSPFSPDYEDENP